MNLFKEFNIQTFKNKKPPADNSMTTFKEINEIKKLPAKKIIIILNIIEIYVYPILYKSI